MILSVTKSAVDYYLNTDFILYGYDNTGLEIVTNTNQPWQNWTDVSAYFTAIIPNVITTPTYGSFVTNTHLHGFVEVPHAVYTTINFNANRVIKLIEIDAGNTTIYFNKFDAIDVVMPIADLQLLINQHTTNAFAPVTTTATTDTTINDPLIIGTALVIFWNGGSAVDGWVQTGTLITFTDGTLLTPGQTIKIIFE